MLYLERVSYERYRKVRGEELWDEDLSENPVVFNLTFPLCALEEDNYWCFIRFSDGSQDPIIGTLSYRHASYLTKIRDIEIRPSYRGRGYGTRIIQLVLDQATQRGSFLVWLFVFDHREAARNIYNKLGFVLLEEFDKGVSLIKNLVRSDHTL